MISKQDALLKLAHDDDAKWNRCEENSAKNRGVKIAKFNKSTGKMEKRKTEEKRRYNSEKHRGMSEYFINLTYSEMHIGGS